MATDRIVLIGLMGSGKTTVGRLVALLLGWPYLDNDELVGRALNANLEALRLRDGGDVLHDAEAAALRAALGEPPPLVASAAASIVTDETNRALLRDSGAFVVWLRIDPETLAGRLVDDHTRPWLGDDNTAVLTRMAEDRDALYAEVSDLTLDATRPPDESAAAIMRALPRSEDADSGRP